MTAGDNWRTKESIDFSSLTTTPSVVYVNTEQEVIIVTRDKLHLCLQGAVDKMASRDRWMVPLGVLVPLILAVTTTSFTSRFNIGGGEWETAYIMLILFTLAWLTYALIRRPKSVSVNSIVEELAKNPVSLSNPVNASVVGLASMPAQAEKEGRQVSDQRDVMSHPESNEARRPHVEMSLKEGDHVRHDGYGAGIVRKVMGDPAEPEALIDFAPPWGAKHLILRYAPIEKLEEGAGDG
jgi:hypothetical protein